MDHVSQIKYLQIIASVLTVYAAFLIAIPNIVGLFVMSLAEILWIVYCVMTEQYWLMSTNILLIGSNIYGIDRWLKQKIG